MFVLLILLFLLLVLFVASLATSILLLYMGWRIGPVLRKDSILLLDHRAWRFLWVVVLSVLFDPMFARADNPIYYVFYAAAAGATPFAAFPGIVLFSGKKQTIIGAGVSVVCHRQSLCR